MIGLLIYCDLDISGIFGGNGSRTSKNCGRIASDSVGKPIYTSENQFIRRIASDFFFVFFLHFLFFFDVFPSFRYFCVFLVSHYVFGFVFLPGSSTDHPLRRLALSMGAAGASLCPLFGIFVQKHSLKNQIYRYIFVLVTIIRRGKGKYDIFSCAAYVRNVHVFAEEWWLNDL